MRFSCVSPFSDAFLMRLRPDPTVSHAHHFFPVHFSCVFCFSRAFFMRPYFIRTYLMRFAAISYSFHAHSDFLMRISCVSVPLHAFSMRLIPDSDTFLMRFAPFFCVSHTLPVRFLCGHYIPKGWQDTPLSYKRILLEGTPPKTPVHIPYAPHAFLMLMPSNHSMQPENLSFTNARLHGKSRFPLRGRQPSPGCKCGATSTGSSFCIFILNDASFFRLA